MNKKKIVFDIIHNIISNAIPILSLQLIILPLVAAKVGDGRYGLIITLVSLFTLFSHPMGSVLNNIRLLEQKEYTKNDYKGDFNILLLISIALNTFIMIFATSYYMGFQSITSLLLIVFISILNLIREYIIVSFRIALNYKGILTNNLYLVLGYFIGYLIFTFNGYWQSIYIFGFLLSIIYILFKSNILNEGIKRTQFFKSTTKKTIILFFSVLIVTALSYADKLLLYPLLGASAVSIYYAATILGKIVSMGITPVNGVILSYLSRMDKIKMKHFLTFFSSLLVVGTIGYIVCVLISEPLLNLLYPEWAEESLKYIYITTLSAILSLISSSVNSFILRFYNINWQVIINIINLILYIILTIVLYRSYGLMGFCIGILISNFLKLLLTLSIYIISFYKSESKINLN